MDESSQIRAAIHVIAMKYLVLCQPIMWHDMNKKTVRNTNTYGRSVTILIRSSRISIGYLNLSL